MESGSWSVTEPVTWQTEAAVFFQLIVKYQLSNDVDTIQRLQRRHVDSGQTAHVTVSAEGLLVLRTVYFNLLEQTPAGTCATSHLFYTFNVPQRRLILNVLLQVDQSVFNKVISSTHETQWEDTKREDTMRQKKTTKTWGDTERQDMRRWDETRLCVFNRRLWRSNKPEQRWMKDSLSSVWRTLSLIIETDCPSVWGWCLLE